MIEPLDVSPAAEYERRLEWVQAVARDGVHRWATRSLVAQAALPVLFSGGCICSISLPTGGGQHLEAIWFLILLVAALAAVFACIAAVAAAVCLVRDWSLLNWKSKALGLAPWLSISTICSLIVLGWFG